MSRFTKNEKHILYEVIKNVGYGSNDFKYAFFTGMMGGNVINDHLLVT